MPSFALVGTSLANAYFADLASDFGASSTFFEASSLGGAWGQDNLGYCSAPRFNNVLFPYSDDQESEVEHLHEWLVRQAAQVKVVTKGFSTISRYRPRQIVSGNFANAIRSVVNSPNSHLSFRRVKRIEIFPSHALVDGQHFDYVILPLNARVDELTIQKESGKTHQKINLAWTGTRSEHVRISSETPIVGNSFGENVDNVFDRFGVIPISENICVGRVSRSFKGQPIEQLIQASFATRNLQHRIISADKQYFLQERLSPSDASKLRSLAIDTRLVALNSFDMITATRDARASISRISRS